MLVMGLDILFAEPDRTSPNLIAKEIKKLNPTLASELSKLPSNEFIAIQSMLKKNEKQTFLRRFVGFPNFPFMGVNLLWKLKILKKAFLRPAGPGIRNSPGPEKR